MLRYLRCLMIPLFIVFAPLVLFILYWWLRTHTEPEPTLMGVTSARPSSAIEIPPATLAAQRQAATAPDAAEVAPAAVAATSFAAAATPAPTRAVAAATPAPEAVIELPAPARAVEISAAPAPLAPSSPDDLRRLEGVGPKVAGLLAAAGITTFAQLAEADVARLRDILDAAKLRFLDPTTWPEQAALAAKGDWAAFEKLTGELKGGRRIED